MPSSRLNKSFLAERERAILGYLVRRMPKVVMPDHLTALGLLGAIVAAAGFILCAWSSLFLIAVVFGIFLNWFGDSLDGTLARYRKTERPHYGFLVDHSSDLIAQTLIVIGLGCSPYFTLSSALFVLSLYMLISSYTYLRAAVEGVHRLSYGGLGATEFRMLVVGWAVFVDTAAPQIVATRLGGYAAVDVVIAALSVCCYLAFVYTVRKDLRRLDADERGVSIEQKIVSLRAFKGGAMQPASISSRAEPALLASAELDDEPSRLARDILAPHPKRAFN